MVEVPQLIGAALLDQSVFPQEEEPRRTVEGGASTRLCALRAALLDQSVLVPVEQRAEVGRPDDFWTPRVCVAEGGQRDLVQCSGFRV